MVGLSDRRYAARPDCIYQWNGSHFCRKRNSSFHKTKDLAHDLGDYPRYEWANVLLSRGVNNFRYFGDRCGIDYKSEYPYIKALVEHMAQGHRVNHRTAVRAELVDLLNKLWKTRSVRQSPPQSESSSGCCAAPSDGCVEVLMH